MALHNTHLCAAVGGVVFIAVALGGIAVTTYAPLDDWKRGRRAWAG